MIEEKIVFLSENITKVVFLDICRGVFNIHKKLFSFLICTSIKRQTGEIAPHTWNILLRGPAPTVKDPARVLENPAKGTITDKQWNTLLDVSG